MRVVGKDVSRGGQRTVRTRNGGLLVVQSRWAPRLGWGVEFRILGPLEVAQDGQSLGLGGAQQRALLAVLLIHRGEVLSTDRLIDELWGEEAPQTAAKTVQGYISQLRKVLGEAAILTRGRGYLLAVGRDQVDVARFDTLVTEGRIALADGDAAGADQRLCEALALWRGEPLAEFAYESFAQAEIARLEESRLSALEARIDAELALGEHSRLVGELEALVHQHPLRERLIGQLMLALYRSGRQAEALESYRIARSRLVEELGLDPGRDLQQLEGAILAQDRALDSPVRGSARGPPATARRRRGGLLIAAAGAVLLVAIAAAVVRLSGSGSVSLRVGANSLAVIDPRSDKVVGSAPVGARPGAIAFGSGSLWVANMEDQTVSRVDPATLQPTRVLTVDGVPTGIAASRHAVWVVESDPGASTVSVNRLDPEFDAVGPTVRIGNVVPGGPAAVAAQGDAVWVAPSSGLLTRLDPATAHIAHQVDPDVGPTAIAVDHGAVWLTDSEANNVTRIDPTGLQTPTAVGNAPSGIAVGAGGVWVADSQDNAIVRIDPNTRSVITTIAVGRSPAGIAVGAGSIWVANSGDGTVTRINPHTDKPLATIPVGGSPQEVTIANRRVWVTVDAQTIPTGSSSGSGTLRMDSEIDVDSMDPARAYVPLSWQILYATCAKLLNYPDRPGPAGGQLTPEVARSLPARSADGKTYTFTIRSGFRFSPPSNEAVTAQTFKYTIERSLNPRLKGLIAHEFVDIAGARAYMAGTATHISGVVARGDTLTIHLLAPAPDFLSRVAQPIFCAVPSRTPIDPRQQAIPSAGPYYVQSYTPGQGIVLLRNPNYRGSRPHRLGRIEVAVGLSTQQAVTDVEKGAADYTTLIWSHRARLRALARQLAARFGPGSPVARSGGPRYFVNQAPELDYLDLNTLRPPFNDARMRQAVNYAINRQALAQLGDVGAALPDRPSDQYLLPGMPGHTNAHIYSLTPDLAKARALTHGKRTTAVLYTCDSSPCDQQGQTIKNDLGAIGITVIVKPFGLLALYSRIARPGEPFDMAALSWTADYPDPSNMLTPLLENRSAYPPFNDVAYRRRIANADLLTGPKRYLAYSKLAFDLARNAAPLVAYGNASSHDLFSARIGCQVYAFYGLDLAALCIKRQTA